MRGFACYVNAIQMADAITASFHYEQRGVQKTVESVYSVERYVNDYAALAGQSQEEYGAYLTLVKALADYGHYAQYYLAGQKHFSLGDETADHVSMDTFFKEDGFSSDEAEKVIR